MNILPRVNFRGILTDLRSEIRHCAAPKRYVSAYTDITPKTDTNNNDWMKSFFLTSIFALTTMLTFAQSTSQPPIQNISTDSTVVYRLFATNNTYNFIKLNTRNGQMWQVQWSLKDNQFETTLSDISRVTKDSEKNGRFFLYPTTNTYNFILLDQIDGRAWQVQWNFDAEKRMVARILNENN